MLAMAVASCGARTNAASPGATTTVPASAAAANYRAGFLAIMAVYDDATAKLYKSTNLTTAQLSEFAAAIANVKARLLAVSWPDNAEGDVRRLVDVLQDLAGAAEAHDFGVFNRDDQLAAAASASAGADVGLPRA